jgi:hypothetical protein
MLTYLLSNHFWSLLNVKNNNYLSTGFNFLINKFTSAEQSVSKHKYLAIFQTSETDVYQHYYLDNLFQPITQNTQLICKFHFLMIEA